MAREPTAAPAVAREPIRKCLRFICVSFMTTGQEACPTLGRHAASRSIRRPDIRHIQRTRHGIAILLAVKAIRQRGAVNFTYIAPWPGSSPHFGCWCTPGTGSALLYKLTALEAHDSNLYPRNLLCAFLEPCQRSNG